MNDYPLISIILPVYNVEMYLEECIISILNQEYLNVEILLIDDGSLDSSGTICNKFAENYVQVRAFHKKNEGVSVARNYGLEHCSGEYVVFIDPDDWIEKTYISEMLKLIKKEQTDVVCCTFYHFNDTTNEIGNPWEGIKTGIEASELLMKEKWYTTVVWNKLFKRECLLKNEKWILFEAGRTVGEDEKWLLDVIADGNRTVLFANKKLYHWRIREKSALHSGKDTITQQMKDEIKTKEDIVEKFSDCKNEKIYALAVDSLYQKTFALCKKAYDLKERSVVKEFYPKMKLGRKAWLRNEWKNSPYSAIRRVYWEMRIIMNV